MDGGRGDRSRIRPPAPVVSKVDRALECVHSCRWLNALGRWIEHLHQHAAAESTDAFGLPFPRGCPVVTLGQE